MTTNIKATGMELTDVIRKYTEDKITSTLKFFDNVQQIDIEVGKTNNHHNKGQVFFAEVNMFIPGNMVRVRKEAVDLYKAIDKVKDHLKVELEKIKGKMREKDKQTLRSKKSYEI